MENVVKFAEGLSEEENLTMKSELIEFVGICVHATEAYADDHMEELSEEDLRKYEDVSLSLTKLLIVMTEISDDPNFHSVLNTSVAYFIEKRGKEE